MSDFFKKFLIEDPRRFGASAQYAALAAFGKHPGWDDHVEDLGLETESLNLAKTVLYVNGIGGQIDSGAWEKLDATQQFPVFNHVFVWQRSGQVLVGRMWSSSDGKGRKRYPMVVCFHFIGVTLAWALKQALPALEDLETECRKTSSAAEVRGLLARKRAALREAIQSADAKGEYAPVSPDTLHKILQPAKTEGFLRVLYQIQSQLGGFGSNLTTSRASPASARAQQVRVPMAAENPEQALLFWTRFFLIYIDSSAPLLLSLPLGADWLDVIVGEPDSHEIFCLRANPKAVPMVSEVPYKLDDTFRAKAAGFLESFQRGETSKVDLQPTVPGPVAPSPAKSGLRKWFGVGAVIAIAAVGLLLLLPKPANQSPQATPSEAQSRAPKPAPAPSPAELAKAEQQKEKQQLDAQAEVARLAQEKKKADAIEAATKLKADSEAAAQAKEREIAAAAAKEEERRRVEAAAKENQRQLAEAARLAQEQQAALNKEILERQRKEAEAAATEKVSQPQQQQPKTQPADVASAKLPVVAVSEAKDTNTVAPRSGSVINEITNSIGMVLVTMPSGIWVGKFEVTQAEYKLVMGTNPSKYEADRQPVERVTWTSAVEFTRKLTEMERATLPSGKMYSLPTEAQWEEFAGGQKFEDSHVAAGLAPAVVGQSGPPNRLGLYDVLGNVWEWCLDDKQSGTKLLKGGSFDGKPFYNRNLSPETTSVSCGFRCVLVPQP